MSRQNTFAEAVLWAAAIIAAAATGAPSLLSLILLPSLATVSLLARPDTCTHRSVSP